MLSLVTCTVPGPRRGWDSLEGDAEVLRCHRREGNRVFRRLALECISGRLKPCGEPLTRLEYQTVVAWTLHVNVATVGWKYGPAIHSHRPIVLFTPLVHGGWKIEAMHQRLASCR